MVPGPVASAPGLCYVRGPECNISDMIPKILHAFWGGPPMPAHLRSYLRRWEDLHPDWELKVWSPGTLPELRNQDLFEIGRASCRERVPISVVLDLVESNSELYRPTKARARCGVDDRHG